jgi:uncharacterized protein
MLGFTSAPLDDDLPLTGHIVAHLSVANSEPDAELFVYASELEANGTLRYMTEGMLSALHRQLSAAPDEYRVPWPCRTFTREDSRPLIPGHAETIVIPLLPIAWTLKRGSRLKLSIAGADARHFSVVARASQPTLSLICGGTAPSKVEVPVRRGR